MSLLECRKLNKNYGGSFALNDIDLQIEPGRIVGLLGPNGSGKTTLIKLINGLLTPTGGEVLIDGQEALTGDESDRFVLAGAQRAQRVDECEAGDGLLRRLFRGF